MKEYKSKKEVYRDILNLEHALNEYAETIGLFDEYMFASPTLSIMNQMICNKKLAKAIKEAEIKELFKGENLSLVAKAERAISFLTAYVENDLKIPQSYVDKQVERKMSLLRMAIMDYNKIGTTFASYNGQKLSKKEERLKRLAYKMGDQKLISAVRKAGIESIISDKKATPYDKAYRSLKALSKNRIITVETANRAAENVNEACK